MLGESDGTKGDATIEQIGRRWTFTRTLQLAIVLAVVQWPMRDAVHDASGSAFDCEVPGRLSLLLDATFIMAYVYAAYRAYKYVKFLNRQSWKQIAAIGSWLVFAAAVLDVIEDVRLWTEFGASTGACADLSTGWFTWLMRGTGLVGVAHPRRRATSRPAASGSGSCTASGSIRRRRSGGSRTTARTTAGW